MIKALRKPYWPYLIVPVFCLLCYMGLIKFGHKHLDLEPHLNYFRDLADAFLHGKLGLINPKTIGDLVLFDGNYYLYWPPVPTLIYVPLVALFGTQLPDALISSLFGMINVWLVMRICNHLSEKYSLELNAKHIIWIGIFWGLGTVHFYMSKEGTIWYVSQIMAQTFLLASVFSLLSENRYKLLISGIFYALAVYTRNHLIFSIIFLFFLYFPLKKAIKIPKIFKDGLLFILPFLICTCLNFWYNYARFGNIIENGIQFHNMAPYFKENYELYGYFSWHYFPHNFFIEVIHFPTLLLHTPFIKHEAEGFGFIWGSPAFLLLFPALFIWMKKIFIKKSFLTDSTFIQTASLLATIPVALVVFLIMGTGWMQFCARYTLDFQFFLLIFILICWDDLKKIKWIKPLTLSLILISISVQYIGAWL